MKLTLIAEGSTKRERKALRWGVSFLVGDVLFDAFGREDIFWENVHRFRINLARVRHVVISHDDWDHIDALGGLLRTQPGVTVHLCQKAGRPLKDLVRNNGGKIVTVDGPRRISDNIFSLGQTRAVTKHGVLYEQALAVKTRRGLSVITGCAHPGITRIVEQAVKLFGRTPGTVLRKRTVPSGSSQILRPSGPTIALVCGGFHMKDQTPEENLKIIARLLKLGVRKVAPLHCTGPAAMRLFRKNYRLGCVDLKEGGAVTL